MSELKEEKPWIFIEEPDADAIVGNRLGLIALREKINLILESPNEEPSANIEDSNLSKIILISKEGYFGKVNVIKETVIQNLLSYFMVFWFLLLPFVAIALIIYMLFFNSSSKTEKVFSPTCSCVKNEMRHKL